MHREVDLTAQEGVAQGADEDAGAAQGGQRGAAAVALGGDLDELDLAAEPLADQVGDEARLGRGEGGGAGAQAQGAHCLPSVRVSASTASGSRRNSSARAAV